MSIFTNPKQPSLDPYGRYAQSEFYPRISSAMGGSGFFPALTRKSQADILEQLKSSYQKAQGDLPALLNRIIPREDIKLRSFMRDELGREYARQRYSTKQEFEDVPFQEKQEAMNMAFDALATEKSMGTDITSMYNQSMARRAGMPTFGGALAGGMGSAAGWAAGMGRGTTSPGFAATSQRPSTVGGYTQNFGAAAYTTPRPLPAQMFGSFFTRAN